ncbi:phosphoribosylglycinamide formyltransferase-1 [Catalinimonas alkaloidigena]|uniref:phosphoribosylglycinamide formyltransferase 1 n=2 Tax=Catalinimonas alkaloidigena TaxID=1075417 RepID=A0A1G9N0P1_9BACT|nr:phosphoribosylglycinamide formyltransferase-1 [Catalinimonas alkaloidigena]
MAYFENHPDIRVSLLLANRPDAYALERAKRFGVPTVVFDRKTFRETDTILQALSAHKVDLVVLAGFLWLVPAYLIEAYPDRILNIHPALLPRFGGKGMWGMHVHEAVVAGQESETGITIHLVNERYDEGRVLFQATCPVQPTDTPEDIQKRVQVLEHRHFPEVIERYVQELEAAD